jgi:hypothetical protein
MKSSIQLIYPHVFTLATVRCQFSNDSKLHRCYQHEIKYGINCICNIITYTDHLNHLPKRRLQVRRRCSGSDNPYSASCVSVPRVQVSLQAFRLSNQFMDLDILCTNSKTCLINFPFVDIGPYITLASLCWRSVELQILKLGSSVVQS